MFYTNTHFLLVSFVFSLCLPLNATCPVEYNINKSFQRLKEAIAHNLYIFKAYPETVD